MQLVGCYQKYTLEYAKQHVSKYFDLLFKNF